MEICEIFKKFHCTFYFKQINDMNGIQNDRSWFIFEKQLKICFEDEILRVS